jgi:hypothetical protein
MADNFPQTPGTGRNVATDQVTYSGDTADVQLVRVVNTSGTEGSRVVTDKPVFQTEDTAHADGDLGMLIMGVRNHTSGSTTDGDYAAVSVSSTGDLHTIGRRDVQRIQVQVSGTAAAAYAAGDQFGTIISLSNAVRLSGGTGTIVGVMLQSYSDTIGAVDVVFLDQSVTLAADNAAFAIADADIIDVIGVVSLAGAYDLGNNRIAQAFNLALPYHCSGSTTLYAAIIIRSAFTLAASPDLATYLTVFVERN